MSDTKELSPSIAKSIIMTLGSGGTPPDYGVQYFTVGLEPYLKVIEDEYLTSMIKDGLSAFKLVIGSYGGGKTHFFYNVRDLAWKNNYVVSYVRLSPKECPFDKLELVYKSIVTDIMRPLTLTEMLNPQERGIESFLRVWFYTIQNSLNDEIKLKDYINKRIKTENISFSNAIKSAFKALIENDEETFSIVVQWLNGEGFIKKIHSKYGITEKIDKTNAFRMIRSLIQWIRQINYSGLVLLFDEGERGISINSSKSKTQTLDTLREIIDECGNGKIPGAMVFYAIPDLNQLIEGNGATYEALKGRLGGRFFHKENPSGVKINLESLDIEPERFLTEIGKKLSLIYEIAYSLKFPAEVIDVSAQNLADVAYSEKFADIGYRRLFIKCFIEGLHYIRSNKSVIIDKNKAKELISPSGNMTINMTDANE
ncbi:MAG: ATP-binding protein [Candidatus Methanoperedenaceae archaeon]|nr:ATP-binding protein [Candidatus Methanoperedenaceae archaeon]